MYRSIAAAFIMPAALAGCHPPDQAIYDESKDCVGVFDVALQRIPSNRLRQAGIYYDDANKAGLESYEDALKFGANTGRAKNVIMKEVAEAKRRAWMTYARSDATASKGSDASLLSAVKQCMPKPAGPND